MNNTTIISFDLMIGQTMLSVTSDIGTLTFKSDSGKVFEFYHGQDCCENVRIDDITGNLDDLVGSPILVAEEVSNTEHNLEQPRAESYTWTFYKFATVKGWVDVRWLGTSNGFYSESVSFKAS